MPDEVAKTDATPADWKVTLDELQKALEAERAARAAADEKRAAAEKNYSALSNVHKQTKAEADRLKQAMAQRRQNGNAPDLDDMDADPPAPQPIDARTAALAAQVGMMRFRAEHPEAAEHWSEIMEMINDPLQVRKIAVSDEDGLLDVYSTSENALARIENSKLRAKHKSDAQKSQEEADKKAALDRAGYAGGGAFGNQNLPSMVGLTVEQQREALVKSGHIKVDPSDPPSWYKR